MDGRDPLRGSQRALTSLFFRFKSNERQQYKSIENSVIDRIGSEISRAAARTWKHAEGIDHEPATPWCSDSAPLTSSAMRIQKNLYSLVTWK